MKQIIVCTLLISSSFFMASDKVRYRSSSDESTTSNPAITSQQKYGLTNRKRIASPLPSSTKDDDEELSFQNSIEITPRDYDEITEETNCKQCLKECCPVIVFLGCLMMVNFSAQNTQQNSNIVITRKPMQ